MKEGETKMKSQKRKTSGTKNHLVKKTGEGKVVIFPFGDIDSFLDQCVDAEICDKTAVQFMKSVCKPDSHPNHKSHSEASKEIGVSAGALRAKTATFALNFVSALYNTQFPVPVASAEPVAEQTPKTQKRGPGRPKGSKNGDGKGTYVSAKERDLRRTAREKAGLPIRGRLTEEGKSAYEAALKQLQKSESKTG